LARLAGLKDVIESVGVKLNSARPVPAGVVTEIRPGIAPVGNDRLE